MAQGVQKGPLPADVSRLKTSLLKLLIGQFFSLSPVAVPEVFAKVKSIQFPTRF